MPYEEKISKLNFTSFLRIPFNMRVFSIQEDLSVKLIHALKNQKLWVLSYIVIFLILGITTLSDYGLTFDEGLGNLFFGERYLRFFVTQNRSYLDFNDSKLAIHKRPLNLSLSPYHQLAHEFPPVADTLSAGTMEVFAYHLHWMDPIDAFHLMKVLLSGLLLWAIYRISANYMSKLAGFVAILVLSTHPRFWGDMHFNPKDVPVTIFFALVIAAYLAWYKKPSRLGAVCVGILEGVALSIKANALFIPIILLLGVWPWQLKWPPWGKVLEHLRDQLGNYILMIFVSLGIHIISWPFLYDSTFIRLRLYYEFIYSQVNRGGSGRLNFDPFIQAITTMPETTLLLLIIGIGIVVVSARKTKNPIYRLSIVWLCIPILRTSLPTATNFDGIRRFEEFLPAASLLAGYGGYSLVTYLSKNKPKMNLILSIGLISVVFVNGLYINLSYHPYEYIYYNSLVGGLSGAHNKYKFPEATDYWATSYRQGMAWLNENAEPNAYLITPIAKWIVDLTSPIWLRKDINIASEEKINNPRSFDRPIYVMFITRESFYTPLTIRCLQRLTPIHKIDVDGVPILLIYRLT